MIPHSRFSQRSGIRGPREIVTINPISWNINSDGADTRTSRKRERRYLLLNMWNHFGSGPGQKDEPEA